MDRTGKNRNSAEKFIGYALRIGALRFRPEGFRLKNGRISPYFFDSGQYNSGDKMSNLTAAYGQTIWRSGLKFDSLYAPPYKGTIIVSSIAIELLDYRDSDVPFYTNRKEEKDHGEGGTFIGSPIQPGEPVLILDDVFVSGQTKVESVEFIKKHRGIPTGLVVALDRQERGSGELSAAQEFERDFQIPVFSIATFADIISVHQEWLDNGVEPIETAKNLESLLAYQRQYGVLTA